MISFKLYKSMWRICVRQLKIFLDQYDFIPLNAISYLAGECNYGGRVTDDKDRSVPLFYLFWNEFIIKFIYFIRRCLMSLLGRAYRTETVEEPNYAFDIDGIFHVPADGDHASYIEHCKVWFLWVSFRNNEKLESTKLNWKEWSWKFRAEVRKFLITQYHIENFPTSLSTSQLNRELSNLNRNFPTSDFPIKNFLTSRFFQLLFPTTSS